jgi:hypothetical protein
MTELEIVSKAAISNDEEEVEVLPKGINVG